MPRLLPISPKKLFKFLEKEGFECVRIKGSHHFFLHVLDRCTTCVPLHSNQDIGVGLLHKILRDIEMSVTDLIEKIK